MKLHPDKNSAPGAEDAFKAVGKAFTILSDADKRAHYDRYGDQVPEEQVHRQRHGEEVNAEDIFNMFFGGGLHPRHAHRRRQHATGQQQQDNRSPLLQFVPLMLILFLSMLSIPSTPEAPFRLVKKWKITINVDRIFILHV